MEKQEQDIVRVPSRMARRRVVMEYKKLKEVYKSSKLEDYETTEMIEDRNNRWVVNRDKKLTKKQKELQKMERGDFEVLFHCESYKEIETTENGLRDLVIELIEYYKPQGSRWGNGFHGQEEQEIIDKIEERGRYVLLKERGIDEEIIYKGFRTY